MRSIDLYHEYQKQLRLSRVRFYIVSASILLTTLFISLLVKARLQSLLSNINQQKKIELQSQWRHIKKRPTHTTSTKNKYIAILSSIENNFPEGIHLSKLNFTHNQLTLEGCSHHLKAIFSLHSLLISKTHLVKRCNLSLSSNTTVSAFAFKKLCILN